MNRLKGISESYGIAVCCLALLIAAAIMLACGPVAQPAPDAGDTLSAMPQVEGGSEEPEVEPTATPTPTLELDCLQAPDLPGGEVCIEPPPIKSLPKYPALGDLSKYAEAAEAAPAAAGASGASGQSGGDLQNVYVRLALTNKASTDAVIAWLESKDVNRFANWSEGDAGRISSFRDDYIYAYMPPLLLVPLSRQEGIVSIDDGCFTSDHC